MFLQHLGSENLGFDVPPSGRFGVPPIGLFDVPPIGRFGVSPIGRFGVSPIFGLFDVLSTFGL